MAKHSRSMVVGLAVLGLALVAAPAFAQNLITINESNGQGVTGSRLFVPTFISAADSTGVGGTFTTAGIYIPYMGTMTPCTGTLGSPGIIGECERWGQASLEAWVNGLYYDPRFGTPFIPPSGDHHRTGYRMLMQPSFSGGAWMSGFAPLGSQFPFFPNVGQAGIGGDIGLALADASQRAALNGILLLTDAHGEPATTGKFPRYWPHERQAWVDTLMVKYTAGGGGDSFAQNFRSSVGFSRNATDVRWRTMSNLDGAFSLDQDGFTTTQNASNGCGLTGWCEFYVTEDGSGTHLFVVKGSDANTDSEDVDLTNLPGTGPDGIDNTYDDQVHVEEVTESTRLDTIQALGNNGRLLKNVKLNDIEKLPSIIDDRLSQFQTEAGTPGDFDQSIASQFRVYSGPNVHSEEGYDPYAWVICGTRTALYGEDDCGDADPDGDGNDNGAIDANGLFIAIVYNPNFPGQLGDSVLGRFGRDLNPARFVNDPNQITDVYVVCTPTGVGTTVVPGVGGNITYQNEICDSDPGGDGFYGSVDDGTVYYKEAIENGLRGWIRETNAHTFSFLGADEDGTHNTISPANFGLTQIVEQREATQGYLMSCLNCSPHSLPLAQDTVNYTFTWPGIPNVEGVLHPPQGTNGPSVTTLNIVP